VRGTVFLTRFKTSGNVSLMGADVGGNIEMDGARLRKGLLAAGTQVGGNVNLRCGFSSEGRVSLDSCKLSGRFDIHKADLGTDVYGYSLTAEGLQAMDVMARDLKAKGIINLLGAHIAGSLEMDGAYLEGDHGASLVADQATVGGSVKIGEKFKATGRVRFLGAKINGQLDIANNSSIASLMLADASVQTLVDGNEPSWPKELDMTGFEYKRLEPAQPGSSRDRLRWLKRQRGGYVPQIYHQLAAMYVAKGQDDDARRVRITGQRRRRRSQGRLKEVLGWVPDVLVGFGYKPWRAVVWGLLLLAIGVPIFGHQQAIQNLTPVGANGSAAPQFSPVLYTLNLLIPVVNLRQTEAWTTHGPATWLATCWTIAGWTLASMVIAGLAGLFRKD